MLTRNNFAVFLISLFLASSAVAALPVAGDPAPEEFGRTLNGDWPKLKDASGKVVVISFWATWCGYCLKELPILEGLQKVAKDNVQVIVVNTESRERFREVARAMTTLTLTQTHDQDKRGAIAYGVKGIPHLIIIGRDGKIIEIHRGYGESTLPQIVETINAAMLVPAPERK
jgi:thiol-disulfide isomerase/thioredoxin